MHWEEKRVFCCMLLIQLSIFISKPIGALSVHFYTVVNFKAARRFSSSKFMSRVSDLPEQRLKRLTRLFTTASFSLKNGNRGTGKSYYHNNFGTFYKYITFCLLSVTASYRFRLYKLCLCSGIPYFVRLECFVGNPQLKCDYEHKVRVSIFT